MIRHFLFRRIAEMRMRSGALGPRDPVFPVTRVVWLPPAGSDDVPQTTRRH